MGTVALQCPVCAWLHVGKWSMDWHLLLPQPQPSPAACGCGSWGRGCRHLDTVHTALCWGRQDRRAVLL